MEAFAYKGKATIKHLNIRKEGDEDDRELAVDVKFEGTTDAESMCAFFDPGLYAFLFNEIGAIRNLSLEPVCFGNTIKNCALSTLGMNVQRVKLKKFSVATIDGKRIALTFSASFFPTEDQVALLSGQVQEEISIDVKEDSLFDGVAHSNSPKAAAAKLDKMVRKDGAKATLSHKGETVLEFGA